MPDLFRSLIFVPGNNPRFLAKARNLEADIVCLDLEDSVPPDRKVEAREMVAGALRGGGTAPRYSSGSTARTRGAYPRIWTACCGGGPTAWWCPR